MTQKSLEQHFLWRKALAANMKNMLYAVNI